MAFKRSTSKQRNSLSQVSEVHNKIVIPDFSPVRITPNFAITETSTSSGRSVTEVIQNIWLSPRRLNHQYQNWDAALRDIALEYEIKKSMVERLHQLQDYKIVIVCDDSGSMNTIVDNTQRTRWDELRTMVKIILRIGVVFDPNGIDVYFINRGTLKNVTNPEQINEIFNTRPKGYSTLEHTLRDIFQTAPARREYNKKLLVFVVTDGEPTDDEGNQAIIDLYYLMIHERHVDTTYVLFLLCTEEKNFAGYLNDWKRMMRNIDVIHDFKTEREKDRLNRGNVRRFTIGDYVVKVLLSAIDPTIKTVMG